MSRFFFFRLLTFFSSFALTNAAWAHNLPLQPDHAHAFFNGFLHPLTGMDHLLVMLAVGAWARFHARALWHAPSLFVLAMAIGFQTTALNVALPDPEFMIALSVLTMGLLLSTSRRLSKQITWLMLAVFGVCHGMAHGLKSGEVAPHSFMLGMLLCTALLHGLGMLWGHMIWGLNHRLLIQRASGWSMALLGASLLAPFLWMAAA